MATNPPNQPPVGPWTQQPTGWGYPAGPPDQSSMLPPTNGQQSEPSLPSRNRRPLIVVIIVLILLAIGTIIVNIFSGAIGSRLANIMTVIGVVIMVIDYAIGSLYETRREAIADLIDFTRTRLLSGNQQGITSRRVRRGGWRWITVSMFLIVVLSGLAILQTARLYNQQHTPPYGCQPAPCVVQQADGQLIGISNGDDSNRFLPGTAKDNPEYLIDQADKNIGSRPYITIIVPVILSAPPDVALTLSSPGEIGYDDLQGAYVLQEAYNDNCTLNSTQTKCIQIRLLVANVGFDEAFALPVAQQIVDLASQDHTVKGVMGWPTSTTHTLVGVSLLGANQILTVSPSASSDELTGNAGLFFRPAPPDSQQGDLAAHFVVKTFPAAQTIAVFYTPDVPYSNTLQGAFTSGLSNKSDKHVIFETYNRADTVDQRRQEIASDVKDAQNQKADLFYFAGYSDDLNMLRNNLASQGSQIPVVAGDAAYDLGSYTKQGYRNLYFVSFASPDEWGSTFMNDPCKIANPFQNFFCEYATDFNQVKHDPPGKYGTSRADSNVMLSYDALTTLVRAVGAVPKPLEDITSNDIRQALLSSSFSFNGVSGHITFGQDGNPINKLLVILHVDASGKTAFLQKCQPSGSTWSCQ